ncbi:MAG: EF-Tu/IF-2/RF-3 family GTPase [Flavonifractor plautii]
MVTGTLTGGPLRRGDRVQLYPRGQTARVRGLQCHGVPAEALPAGVRAAVNLAGVRLRDVGRGDTLAAPGALTLTDRTDVSLRVLPDAPFPVHTGSQLHFHRARPRPGVPLHPPGAGRASPRRGGVAQLRFTPARPAAAPGDTGLWRASSPPWPRWEAACWRIRRPRQGLSGMRPERLARLYGRPGGGAAPPGGESPTAAPAAPAAPAPSAEAEGSWRPSIWGTAPEPPPGRARWGPRFCRDGSGGAAGLPPPGRSLGRPAGAFPRPSAPRRGPSGRRGPGCSEAPRPFAPLSWPRPGMLPGCSRRRVHAPCWSTGTPPAIARRQGRGAGFLSTSA